MGRPAKTTDVILNEKKAHRTKKELETRKNGEKSVLTGEKMRESKAVKANEKAHAHFGRVRKLMGAIGRDDAIHENVINRYCLLLAEADDLEIERAGLMEKQADARARYEDREMPFEEWIDLDKMCFDQIMKTDAALDKKRQMLFNIERENLMTVSSGMRAVPKKPQEEEADPMEEMLSMRPMLVRQG